MNNKKAVVRLFFTLDDNYIPFLSTTLASIVDHASPEYKYQITIIHDGLSLESKKAIRQFRKDNIFISFFNVSVKVNSLAVKLDVRDYYTITTYYRLFLPDLFPTLSKGLYLDSDIVLCDDVAKLYFTDLGDNLVGAIPDASVQLFPEFSNYVEKVLGVEHQNYFNAGVLLMNFKALRSFGLERRFLALIKKVTFKVAQDQDVLNYLCKDRVTYVDKRWNVMPLGEEVKDPWLIHYNLMFKPWNLKNIMYEDRFFKYAEMAGVKDNIIKDACFDGTACTISTSSTDIMCDLLRGKEITEGRKIIDAFHKMMHEEEFDADLLDEAIVFINTSKQAARIRCATIGWNAAEEILKDK